MRSRSDLDVLAEVRAMCDVLDDIAERTDAMSPDDAIAAMEALTALKRVVADTIGLCEAQLINTLESPREIDGKLYEVVSNGKWRPDHMAIDSAVIRASTADRNGELRPSRDAAEVAVRLMRDLFVSPSTFPKTGGLDRLGLDKPDVGSFDRSGKKVKVTEVAE